MVSLNNDMDFFPQSNFRQTSMGMLSSLKCISVGALQVPYPFIDDVGGQAGAEHEHSEFIINVLVYETFWPIDSSTHSPRQGQYYSTLNLFCFYSRFLEVTNVDARNSSH